MACTSSCYSQDHASYGECLRSKNLKTQVSVPGRNYDRSGQPGWDKRINAYKQARSEGIQPASTKAADIKAAVQKSDATGQAYQAI